MAITVQISVAPLEHANSPFNAVVEVTGAPAGAKVTATLQQEDGLPPLWGPASKTKTAPASGFVAFSFEVTMIGPAQATLEATVEDDKQTDYPPDVEPVQIVALAGVQ